MKPDSLIEKIGGKRWQPLVELGVELTDRPTVGEVGTANFTFTTNERQVCQLDIFAMVAPNKRKNVAPSGSERPADGGFTTRLQKGGALLQDMRQMVCQWTSELDGEEAFKASNRILHKSTRVRSADTFQRAFKPRFIAGSPTNAWMLARTIEDQHPPIEVVRPFYFWLTARAEPLLHRFVTSELFERAKSHDPEIRINETASWIKNTIGATGKIWTPTVRLKVARGMLAALRDFGILEGATRKRIAPQHLALEAFCLIAFCLHELGFEQKNLVSHPDWKLFLLTHNTVERLFLEAHQNGWLDYQCVGEIYRIEFKSRNLRDYAHDLLGR